jgi:hypothetical protein
MRRSATATRRYALQYRQPWHSKLIPSQRSGPFIVSGIPMPPSLERASRGRHVAKVWREVISSVGHLLGYPGFSGTG